MASRKVYPPRRERKEGAKAENMNEIPSEPRKSTLLWRDKPANIILVGFIVLALVAVMAWYRHSERGDSWLLLLSLFIGGALIGLLAVPAMLKIQNGLNRKKDYMVFIAVVIASVAIGFLPCLWSSSPHAGETVISCMGGWMSMFLISKYIWYRSLPE